MASVAGHSLLTFLLLFAISCPRGHARESRGFGKVTREEEERPTETVVVPEETPAVQVEKAARLGKEMYGYSYDSHDDAAGFSTSFPPNTKPDAEYGSHKNRESSGMHRPNYGRRKDQYGMSDTRFLENGRYFYDVNAERGYGAYAGIGVGGADHRGYGGAYNNGEGNKEGEEEYVP